MNDKATLKNYLEKINEGILELLPSPNARPSKIHEAMHYSMLAGGKRLRPLLLISSYDIAPTNQDPIPAAIAIECIHTYSLIHDDLPCMDDADQRRGKPTSHKKFDEATALLAGDALLTYAFELISHAYKETPAIANALVIELSEAAGSKRLIGGQMLDLLSQNSKTDPEQLEEIHLGKTSAMITASITMGLKLADANEEKITTGRDLGKHLGLAFQIKDDILDCTASENTLGKDAGKDAELNKLTYPSVYGLDESEKKASAHSEKALELCAKLGGNNGMLQEIIEGLCNRVA